MNGKDVRLKREKLGLTQQQLADQIYEKVLKGTRGPISRVLITKVENGHRPAMEYFKTFFDLALKDVTKSRKIKK